MLLSLISIINLSLKRICIGSSGTQMKCTDLMPARDNGLNDKMSKTLLISYSSLP